MTSIPPGARILLDHIGWAETARKPPEAYGVVIGHRQSKLPQPLTEFALDELLSAQKLWQKNWKGSASGRYQIIRKTLLGLVAEMGLPGSTRFSAETQDAMGYHLLKRRGYAKFANGTLNTVAFGRSLAQEWASFPVLASTQGAHRFVMRGQSYYAGDGVNASRIKPEEVEAILAKVRGAVDADPPPVPVKPVATPAPVPVPPAPPSLLALIVAGLLGLFKFIASVFTRKDKQP